MSQLFIRIMVGSKEKGNNINNRIIIKLIYWNDLQKKKTLWSNNTFFN